MNNNKTLWIGLLIAAVFGFWGMTSYNGLVDTEADVDSQWGNVQNAYQRRADLIPNLVETAKGYANFEQGVLTQIAEARAQVGKLTISKENLSDPDMLRKFNEAQGQLGVAASRLLSVAENYPELKANTNFLALTAELAGSENRISIERNKFNEAAKDYNKSVKKFPGSIFAKLFGFEEKAYFEAEAGAQSAPKVKF